MQVYTINKKHSSTILFEGAFNRFIDYLQAAVDNNTDLSHADLRHKNLSNANLDDARLQHADFTGANLSEARLYGCNFTNTGLYNTCFAYADLQHSQFKYTGFGGTDITGSNISFAQFSGLSCFSLDFTHVSAMRDCLFVTENGTILRTSSPPVVVKGLKPKPIILMQNQIHTPETLHTIEYFSY